MKRIRMLTAAVLALAVSAVVAAPATADPGTANGKRGLPTFAGQVSDGAAVYDTKVKVKEVGVNEAGELVATAYRYRITGAGIDPGDVNVGPNSPLALPMGSDRGSRCTILHLDLQPLFLDLLGLELTTSEIVIDLTAVTGPNKLLGNLLCAITGLLDPSAGGGGGGLTGLQQLIDNVNRILGRILGTP